MSSFGVRAVGLVVVWMTAGAWVIACSDDDAVKPTVLPDAAAPGDATPDVSKDPLPPHPPADASIDVEMLDAGPTDAGADANADASDGALPVLKRVSGNVDLGGPVPGAKVEVLQPTPSSLTTDSSGDFFFFAPLGSTVVVKVTPPADAGAGALPMIRGIVVGDANRIRVFYLAADAEKNAATALGTPLDLTKAIVEVDFRNASIGGYGATMKNGAATVTPGFGVALDSTDTPRSTLVTLTGGGGSTLLLGDVPPGNASFTPVVPTDAGLPCTPCDAPLLPLQAGVVTWFDFECGSATDCR